ncbi:MAG: YicC family protein [Lewinellaceae bacterium]|nr:YicC family protein [Saprospiraceae bacterium]MCB9315308.1 YicC family protein [Lewinellaceae bacterium]MCB9333276.1 YicC family protein [Lewinellaceae bacterium]
MTGYGRASGHFNGKTISVEIRTLNSRLTDMKMRLPGDYKEKEIEVRKLVTQHAERGKIDLLMDVQSDDGGALVTLNEGLFRGYHRELTRLANELDIPQHDILQTIMRIPNVASTPSGEVDDEEWEAVCRIITEALDQLRAFRDQEGDALEADLQLRVSNILSLLQKVEPHEKERFTRMRERLNNNMEDVFGKEKLDANRFEQEILYYLEKMDITEEKVRLEQHCKYFIEQVNNKEISGGRTLNFISQEMGREINTLGAKAYDANIQRLVVQMKDELEKIKEQLANVL